jgi:hypothetical protein
VQARKVTHNTPQIPAYRDIPFVRLKNETDPTSSILYRKKNLMTREASPLCPFLCNTKVANSRTDGFNKGSIPLHNSSSKTSSRSSFVQPTSTAFKQPSDSDTACAMAQAGAWFSVSPLYVGSTVDKLTMGWFCQGRLRFSPDLNQSTIAVLRLLTVSAVAVRWMRGVSTVRINVYQKAETVMQYPTLLLNCRYTTHSFIPLTSAECDESLPFSLLYTLFHQLVFHPPSLHLAIYCLVYLSALLFPNLKIIPFGEFYFLPFSVHAQNNVIYSTLLSLE